MISRYIAALRRLNGQLNLLKEIYKRPKAYFWLDTLNCFLFHGASAREYINFELYKLNHIGRRQFVTMRRSYTIRRLLNSPEYAHIFNDKRAFNKAFSDFIERKWIYAPEVDEEDIINFVCKMGTVVVKPTNLSGGRGVFVLTYDEIGDVGRFCVEVKHQGCLIEEYIAQAPELARPNSSSVNTIRAYTLINKKGTCELIFAALRVGGPNARVDNYHSGGVGYAIDLDSGIISQPGADMMGNRYIYHPSTNFLMVGFRVPRWEEIREFVSRAANVFPECRYIGWDVAVTKRGLEMIEGNYSADHQFLQALDRVGKRRILEEAI